MGIGTIITLAILLVCFIAIAVLIRRIVVAGRKDNPLIDSLAPYVDSDYFRKLEELQAAEEEAAMLDASASAEGGLFRRIASVLGKMVLFQGYQQKLGRKLQQAGMKWRANEYLLVILLSALLGFFIGFIFQKLYLMIILAFVGYIIPNIYIGMQKKKRLKGFQDQLVDTLGLISNSLKAGYSFLQAVEMVSREAPTPTNEEFGRVVRENSLGMPIDEALEAMAARMESEDLDLTVTVVLIQRQIGGNLSEILETIAMTIRERIKLVGQIKALTAQGKMGGIVITALPFGLYFVMHLLNPEVMSMLYSNAGEGYMNTRIYGFALIAVGLVMQFLGGVVIWKMTSIEM